MARASGPSLGDPDVGHQGAPDAGVRGGSPPLAAKKNVGRAAEHDATWAKPPSGLPGFAEKYKMPLAGEAPSLPLCPASLPLAGGRATRGGGASTCSAFLDATYEYRARF